MRAAHVFVHVVNMHTYLFGSEKDNRKKAEARTETESFCQQAMWLMSNEIYSRRFFLVSTKKLECLDGEYE